MNTAPTVAELLLAQGSPAGYAMAAEGIPSGGELFWCYDHHALINRWLVNLRLWRIEKVCMSAPRRHGKSTLAAQWGTAHLLGAEPNESAIIACSTAALVEEHSKSALRIMQRHGVRYWALEVEGGETASWKAWRIQGRKGLCRAVSVGGTASGFGASWLVGDDLIKGREVARSQTQRDNVWQWVVQDLFPTLNPGRILNLGSRWHIDDVWGRIEERLDTPPDGESDPDYVPWHYLTIPALALENDPLGRKPGEALWPRTVNGRRKYPAAHLRELARTLPWWFAANMQGDPRPEAGAKFDRSTFRYARVHGSDFVLDRPEGAKRVPMGACAWYIVGDFAAESKQDSDYSALGVLAMTPDSEVVLCTIQRDKVTLGEQWPWMLRTGRGYEQQAGVYASWGAEYRQGAHATFGMAEAAGRPLEKLPSGQDKVMRAQPLATAYRYGRVYHLDRGAPWVAVYEEELLLFPAGSHDDQVDVASHGWNWAAGEAGVAMADMDPDGNLVTTWGDDEAADADIDAQVAAIIAGGEPPAQAAAEQAAEAEDTSEADMIVAGPKAPRRERRRGIWR